MIDVPNHRSMHVTPTLRGGGVAPATAILFGGLIATFASSTGSPDWVVLAITAGCVAAATIGFAEDMFGLPVVVRAVLQIILGACLALALAWGTGQAAIIAVGGTLLVAAYINVANFMDGVNLVSGLHGGVVGVVFALFGALIGSSSLVVIALVVSAAFFAFIPWNIAGSGMFLGDVGSYLLGASIAGMAVASYVAGIPLLASISPLWIYLSDTGFTLVSRVLRGEKWYEAHRSHVYQRLSVLGWSHITVALFVTGMTMVAVAAGSLSLLPTPLGPLSAVGALVVICLLYLSSPAILARVRTTPSGFGVRPAGTRRSSPQDPGNVQEPLGSDGSPSDGVSS